MVKTITNWQTLMKYAHELGQARKSGDKERIIKAEETHDNYKELCLKADAMNLGVRNRDLK